MRIAPRARDAREAKDYSKTCQGNIDESRKAPRRRERKMRAQFAARKTSEALVPPKPKEFESAALISRLRAV